MTLSSWRFIGDKNLGLLETVPEIFPEGFCQRCTGKTKQMVAKLQDGIEETLTYMDIPQHRTQIRTNNTIEQLNRESKRRIKAIRVFLDGQSALMFVCARLRYVARILDDK